MVLTHFRLGAPLISNFGGNFRGNSVYFATIVIDRRLVWFV